LSELPATERPPFVAASDRYSSTTFRRSGRSGIDYRLFRSAFGAISVRTDRLPRRSSRRATTIEPSLGGTTAVVERPTDSSSATRAQGAARVADFATAALASSFYLALDPGPPTSAAS
jgi:hypothetical protein